VALQENFGGEVLKWVIHINAPSQLTGLRFRIKLME
jgi:hypothetical protein